jgi:hypothetical protein
MNEVLLPMWKGFRAKREVCTGKLAVDHHGSRRTERQKAALAGAVARAARMKPRILAAIVAAYPNLRQWSRRPKTITVAQLKNLIAPWELLLSTDHFQGEGYVFYEFSCAWDPSGIVVLTHGERVVGVGDGDFELMTYPHRDPARTSPPRKRKAAKKRGRKAPAALPAEMSDELWIGLPPWDGEIGVALGGDAMGDGEIGPAQQAAYRLVVKEAKKQRALVLDALAKEFADERKKLLEQVELTSVHIHWIERDGLAYVGYELSCEWDNEHGAGVLMHADRVVEVGQADTAILGWIAKRDAKKRKR